MYDTIIIGGGPCGLTAAIYLARACKKVLIIEKENFGGQITQAFKVENYPGFKDISGLELARLMKEQVDDLGIDCIYGTVTNILNEKELFQVNTEQKVYESKTVLLATGSSPKKMGILGEKEFTGKGVSCCATCDGSFFKEKEVAVVGGGNTAIIDALYLSNICKKVYLIHRRDTFRAEPIRYITLKKKKNVEFLLNTTVQEIKGNEVVESVIIQENGIERMLKIDGIFIAIEREPNTSFLEDLILLDPNGFAEVNHRLQSSLSGLFIAGDVRKKIVRQLTTATGDGAEVAHHICDYLEYL